MKPECPTFDKTWRDSCEVTPVNRSDVDDMIRRHYIGKWPGVCVLTLAMRQGKDLLGVCVFALPPRETSKRYGANAWELARLWLCSAVPQNGETWFIANAVRHIRKFHLDVDVLVSYADPSAGHQGTIYKAANWVCDGRTDQDRKTARFDYACSDTGKKYSRSGHIPIGKMVVRIPRVSKFRFIYRIIRKPTREGNRMIHIDTAPSIPAQCAF